jgi:hypothetical protein
MDIGYLGIKFFLLAEPNAVDLNTSLKRVYELFSDYVVKNPFYVNNQPIKCPLFDTKISFLKSD